MKDRNDILRETPGNVEFSDPLTTFLYLLVRDTVPAGKIEMLVNEVVDGETDRTFTNGWLAQYANNLSELLQNAKARKLQQALEGAFTDPKREAVVNAELQKSLMEEITAESKKMMSDDAFAKMEDELKSMQASGLNTPVDPNMVPEKNNVEIAKEAVRSLVEQGHMSKEEAANIEEDIDEAAKEEDKVIEKTKQSEDAAEKAGMFLGTFDAEDVSDGEMLKNAIETSERVEKIIAADSLEPIPVSAEDVVLLTEEVKEGNTTTIDCVDVTPDKIEKWKNTNEELKTEE